MRINRKHIIFYILPTLLIAQFCVKDDLLGPTAKFIIHPSIGNTQNIYVFDASQSGYNDNSQESIVIRWDWENDEEWDTDFSSELIQQHQFNESGIYTIKLQVKNSNGVSSFLTRDFHVTDSGPLGIPEIISPEIDGKNIKQSINLKWKCYHSEDSIIKYDIYFGDRKNPPLINTNYISTILDPGSLKSNTIYYWKIVAKDKMGNITSSPVNSFFTHLFDQRDEQEYDIFLVGKTFWMAENLNFQPDSGWYYNGDNPKNGEIYGKLYNWDVAMIYCPEGWHLPDAQEWQSFEIFLLISNNSGSGTSDTGLGDMIKEGGSSEFNALMGGTRNELGNYSYIGMDAGFWSSSGGNGGAYYWYIIYNQPHIFRSVLPEASGLSVRCVIDEE
ncbi:FISUMP domain-containing protein [Bacteroidota bacterium]